MIVVVRGPLRRLVGFEREIRVEAPTVHAGLQALCLDHPDLRRVLFDASGRVRGVHRIAVNHTILLSRELDDPVADGDVVEVVTALAGG